MSDGFSPDEEPDPEEDEWDYADRLRAYAKEDFD